MDYSHRALNYSYVLERALSLANTPSPEVLDFGCGRGTLLELAAAKDFPGTLWGVDSFTGVYQNRADAIPEEGRSRIRRIVDNHLPFDSASFDVVVSNQVFEHVFQPQPILAEINRVLKPNGAFLALFPTSDCWFEGHLGLYFVHWINGWPRLQRIYCRLCRAAGFGYYYEELAPDAWASRAQAMLRDACVYHHVLDVRRWWKEAFGTEPESLAEDYMVWRIERDRRLKSLKALQRSAAGRALMRFLCHKRAGRILAVRKSGAGKTAGAVAAQAAIHA